MHLLKAFYVSAREFATTLEGTVNRDGMADVTRQTRPDVCVDAYRVNLGGTMELTLHPL